MKNNKKNTNGYNMVNTFILAYDVREAVRLLDKRRLGKQRVEAQQILRVLLDSKIIAKHMGLPPQPTTPGIPGDIEREIWYKNVYSRYRKHDTRYVLNGRTIKGGWSNHPMAIMWIGYEKALKEYINFCIDEWVSRGFKNNMSVHIIKSPPVYPWWVTNKSLINSHISAVLRKEFCRKEPKWYWGMDALVQIADTEWYRKGYLWVGSLTLEQRLELYNGTHSASYCHEQMNDIV
jgi:hypothetical protein